jgi:NADPH2:quinone reductase
MIAFASMRAVLVRQFGGPEVLQVEELPDPKPGSSEVVVHVRAAGVNPVDAYIRAGTYVRKPALPYVPGLDGAGEVESVGTDVKEFAPGDRVYIAGFGSKAAGAGTYAERAVCAPAQLHHLPARVSFAQGAALGVPYTTAYRALFHRAAARPGETVLVHGATGGVGTAAVQMARAQGMTVIGTGGTEAGLQLVREQGANAVANHRESNYLEEVTRAAGSRGVDVVIEMAAHVNLDKDLSLLARRGRVVVVGNRGRVEIDPRQAMARDAAILGMTIFNTTDADMVSIQAALVAGLSNGTLKPVIGREMPLADAGRAHQAIMEAGALGKIVLVV